jgi:hypothetical protein
MKSVKGTVGYAVCAITSFAGAFLVQYFIMNHYCKKAEVEVERLRNQEAESEIITQDSED